MIGRDEIAKIIMEAQNCGIGDYDADGKWQRICCNDPKLKGEKRYYWEECDCAKAADALAAHFSSPSEETKV